MSETIKGINIVIGSDTTALSKALGDVNKKSKDIQSELKQVEKLLKLDPSNTELLRQKQKLLADAVANTKTKLDSLKKAQEQVNDQFKKGEINEGQYRAFQRELIKTEGELEKLEGRLKKTNPALESFGAKAKAAGEKLTNVGGNLTKYVTVPLAAAGAGLVAVAKQFDDAFDKIRIGTGTTGDALAGLENDFRAVAKDVPSSFDEISTAIADYNKRLDLTGPALQKLAAQTLNLSRITKTDLSSNIDKISVSFQAFNLDANKYGESLDYIFKVSQSTGIGIDQLLEDLQKFAPALKQLGFNFEESAALMGVFKESGVSVEQGLTGLNKAVVNMAKDGVTNASDAVKQLFESIKNAPSDLAGTQIALDVFGAKAGPALASAIREGKVGYEELMAALKGSGETINGAAADTDDWAEGLAKLKNNLFLALEPISGQLFDALNGLIPLLTGVITVIAGVIEKFMNMPDGVQAAILVILGLMAVVGPLLTVIGSLLTLAGALGIGIGALAAPIGIAILAIAAIITIGVTLYKHWDDIKAAASALWDHIVNVWNSIKEAIGNALSGIIDLFFKYHPIGIIISQWDEIKAYFSNLASEAIDWGRNVIQGFIDGIYNKIAGIGEALRGAAQTIKDFLGFSSPTKEGPGREADKWAPNLMDMFAEGIRAKADILKKELSDVLKFPDLQFEAKVQKMISVPAVESTAGNKEINIEVNNFGTKGESSEKATVRELQKLMYLGAFS